MANLVAFQVEIALNPESSAAQKLSSKAQLHVGILYFRDAAKQWKSAKWASRVLEWVVEKAGLSLGSGDGSSSVVSNPATHQNTDEATTIKMIQQPVPETLFTDASVSFEELADNLFQGLLDDNVATSLEEDLYRLFGA